MIQMLKFISQFSLNSAWGIGVRETKCQFHQRSTRSFYVNSLAPVNYKPKM
jgi:hypothetical protein